MRHDDSLAGALRSAMPPVVPQALAHDLWPLVVRRGRNRQPWSWVDVGLAVAAAAGLLARPDLLLLLAYHF
jgi:hypothetical protein